MKAGKVEQENHTHKKGAWGEMLVYVSASTVSLLVMWGSIREFFYDKMKTSLLAGVVAERDRKRAALVPGPDYLKKFGEVDVWHREQVGRLFEQAGIRNSLDKFWYGLNKYEKFKVISYGLTATVALGAYFNIRHRHQLAEQIEQMNRKKESAQPSHAR
jgi:hypothetical protein